MAIEVNNVLEVGTYARAQDQLGVNIYHYRVDAVSPTPPTHVELANYIYLAWRDEYINATTLDVLAAGASVKNLSSLTEATGYSTSPPTPGTNAAEILPRQVSGIIQKRSLIAGRQNQGRVYIPFPGENYNDGVAGTPNAAYLAVLTLIGNLMIPSVSWAIVQPGWSITLIPAIFHRASLTATRVHSFALPQKWATQRRRGSFGKANPTPF